MKINWNNRYATIAMYAFLVICASILLYLGISQINLIEASISDFIGTYYLHILGILLVIGLLFTMLYKNSKVFRYGVQWIVLHIPVVSDIVKYNQLVMFTSTFATLIKHDVFITDSMDILGRISNNEIYKEIINKAIVNLSNGESLSKAFEGHWAFPDTAYEMLVTGERTGRLGPMMENVAN